MARRGEVLDLNDSAVVDERGRNRDLLFALHDVDHVVVVLAHGR
jgi:hypothetical protein